MTWAFLAAFLFAAPATATATPTPARIAIETSGGTVVIRMDAVALPEGIAETEVRAWVGDAARGVTGIYGRLPGKEVTVHLLDGGRGRLSGGLAKPGRVEVGIGRRTTAGDLARDWRMTHEMVHLGFPDVGDRHDWMHEGLATWLEPVIRARAGNLSVKTFWSDLVRDLPRCAPSSRRPGASARTPTPRRSSASATKQPAAPPCATSTRSGNRSPSPPTSPPPGASSAWSWQETRRPSSASTTPPRWPTSAARSPRSDAATGPTTLRVGRSPRASRRGPR